MKQILRSGLFSFFLLLSNPFLRSDNLLHPAILAPIPITAETKPTPSPQPEDEGMCLITEEDCDDPALEGEPYQAPDEAILRNADVIAVVFWMKDCVHCTDLMDEILPAMNSKYGAKVAFFPLELGDVDLVNRFYKMGERFGIPANKIGVPLLVLDDQILIGAAIQAGLEKKLDASLTKSNNSLPVLTEFEEILPEAVKERQSDTIKPGYMDQPDFAAMMNQVLKLAIPTLVLGVIILIGLKIFFKRKSN